MYLIHLLNRLQLSLMYSVFRIDHRIAPIVHNIDDRIQATVTTESIGYQVDRKIDLLKITKIRYCNE